MMLSPGRWGPASSHFGRLADDAGQRPALAPAHRPRLGDRDRVAGLRFVLLVVHHELRGAALGLAVEAVTHLPLDSDDDALLHLVADDDADFFRLLCHRCDPAVGEFGELGSWCLHVTKSPIRQVSNYPRFCLSTV